MKNQSITYKDIIIIIVLGILAMLFMINYANYYEHSFETVSMFPKKDNIKIEILNAPPNIESINIVNFTRCALNDIYSENEEILNIGKNDTLIEDVEPFIYDYDNYKINENYDHNKYFIDAYIRYEYEVKGKYSTYMKFKNENELIEYYKENHKLEEQYIKENYQCKRNIFYNGYLLEIYKVYKDFNVNKNKITINPRENKVEYVNEHLKKYPYAIGISLVNKEGNIINKLVCNFPMKMEYANADGWQYDWETGELEYKYNLKTILEDFIKSNLKNILFIGGIIFFVALMITIKLVVSKGMKINFSKKLLITHIILQLFFVILTIFLFDSDLVVNRVDLILPNVLLELYFVILVILDLFVVMIFSIIEIFIYTKILKIETIKRTIKFSLISNILNILILNICFFIPMFLTSGQIIIN